MANTTSENVPRKSFSRGCRKSKAVRCGSLPKAPHPCTKNEYRIAESFCDREYAMNTALKKVSGFLLANRGSVRRGTGDEAEQPRLVCLRAVIFPDGDLDPDSRNLRRFRIFVSADSVCKLGSSLSLPKSPAQASLCSRNVYVP